MNKEHTIGQVIT